LLKPMRTAYAIMKKDVKIYYLKPPVLIFGVLFPAFLFLAFCMGRELAPRSVLPGLIGMTLFFTSSSVGPIVFPWETRMRTLERLISAPVSVGALLAGDVAAGVLFSAAITTVLVVAGALALGVAAVAPLLLAAAIALSALCFSCLGILFSAPPTDNPSNVMMLSSLVRLPIIFISGVFVPVDRLPPAGRAVAAFSPLTYSVDLVRMSFGEAAIRSAWVDLAVLSAFALVLWSLALLLHARNMPARF